MTSKTRSQKHCGLLCLLDRSLLGEPAVMTLKLPYGEAHVLRAPAMWVSLKVEPQDPVEASNDYKPGTILIDTSWDPEPKFPS